MQKQWNKVKWWKYPKCLVTTLLKIRMNSNFSKFVSTFILLLIVEYGGMYPSPMFKWQKWLDWENKLGYIKFSVLRFLLKLKKLCNPPSWLLESKLHAPTQTFLRQEIWWEKWKIFLPLLEFGPDNFLLFVNLSLLPQANEVLYIIR